MCDFPKNQIKTTGVEMGEFIKQNDQFIYRQEDGRITAWFHDFEEHLELAHEGDPRFKMILYVLVIVGMIYLAGVFTFF